MTEEPEEQHTDAPVPASEIAHLLAILWHGPVLTKSNTAREWADAIAAACCLSLITTANRPGPSKIGGYGRVWKLTPEGIVFLWEKGERF